MEKENTSGFSVEKCWFSQRIITRGQSKCPQQPCRGWFYSLHHPKVKSKPPGPKPQPLAQTLDITLRTLSVLLRPRQAQQQTFSQNNLPTASRPKLNF